MNNTPIRSPELQAGRASGDAISPSGHQDFVYCIDKVSVKRYAIDRQENGVEGGLSPMSWFPNVPKIQYEGRDPDNPLAFRHYNPQEKVLGKTMEEHLRFAVAYWHTFTAAGADPFGVGTAVRKWDSLSPMDKAKARVEANFELLEKLGIRFFCFHDVDIAPEGASL